MAGKTLAQNSPEDYIRGHNLARNAVGVGPVMWDESVAAYAREYANKRIGDCRLIHSKGPYGENLFWGSWTGFTGVDAVNAWASEKQYYNYTSNSCRPGQMCGHYTQIVWRSSTKIGCASLRCNNGGIFIICNYKPAGNVIGRRANTAATAVATGIPKSKEARRMVCESSAFADAKVISLDKRLKFVNRTEIAFKIRELRDLIVTHVGKRMVIGDLK
ncbi:hypothetical protein J5N97_028463 [Dioscorea zingiberensis]|uniref:SCP domain-containing protein n=1 Tax=Dioscorea zingiberensis TaxID=325984 RepID=A0A9D5BZ55_9LILI|nr:hypothetical protein J5N97_028463 [Dioscorea zingiberensis]